MPLNNAPAEEEARLAAAAASAERDAPFLSALMCVRNAEDELAECLASLAFADEIVVVLDRSSDRSKEIAEAAGARIVEGAFPLEGTRRNRAIAEARGPWLLEVDADERVPPALAEEIRATIATTDADRHLVPIDNYVGERLVRYGWGASFGTSRVPRLFRKGTKRWGDQRVHPRLEMTGKAGPMLQHALVHHVDRDISAMLNRLDRYSSARAADLREAGIRTAPGGETLSRNIWRIPSRFYKCYVRRKGYKEGGMGLLIALLASLYPFISYLKATLEDE